MCNYSFSKKKKKKRIEQKKRACLLSAKVTTTHGEIMYDACLISGTGSVWKKNHESIKSDLNCTWLIVCEYQGNQTKPVPAPVGCQLAV